MGKVQVHQVGGAGPVALGERGEKGVVLLFRAGARRPGAVEADDQGGSCDEILEEPGQHGVPRHLGEAEMEMAGQANRTRGGRRAPPRRPRPVRSDEAPRSSPCRSATRPPARSSVRSPAAPRKRCAPPRRRGSRRMRRDWGAASRRPDPRGRSGRAESASGCSRTLRKAAPRATSRRPQAFAPSPPPRRDRRSPRRKAAAAGRRRLAPSPHAPPGSAGMVRPGTKFLKSSSVFVSLRQD